MKKIIHLIAAARPNFMKIAPLWHALQREEWADARVIHTGQHYDVNMSDQFFRDLNLPQPHRHLGVGSGTHAEQTGRVMIACEQLFMQERPDLVVVVGDVNSTLAATLAASKLGVATAHLEAGLRSFDRRMPEEINRMVTDALADILWTPSADADQNLLREGIPPGKIHRVGNIMIDSLEMLRPRIEREDSLQGYGLSPGRFAVVTLHRPSNVDDSDTLERICDALVGISRRLPVIFPVHPRTRKNLAGNGRASGLSAAKNLKLIDPLSYIPFMNLVFNCRLVITDSGGLQEETTYLGIPCLTLRSNTERPITVTQGTNRLCTPDQLPSCITEALSAKPKDSRIPELWDGKTAGRVVGFTRRYLFPDSGMPDRDRP